MKLNNNGNEDVKHKLTKNQIIIIVAAVAVAVIICGFLIAAMVRGHGSIPDGANNLWSDLTGQENDGLTDLERDLKNLEDNGIDIPDLEIDFAELRESTNKDIYAWIYIPDTEVNYPVLQHRKDDTYYLNHNLDGTEGYPGVIYSESCNSTDFEDLVTVLYGHNMKDGSMFGGLKEFQDKEYFDSHPYIYVYTEDRLLAYEIVAAYTYTDEHLLKNDDISTPSNYVKYLADMATNARKNGIWKGGINLQSDDNMLALSTCVSGQRENRFLIQGKLLQ